MDRFGSRPPKLSHSPSCRGSAKQTVDQGYGIVCDLAGRPYQDLIVADANQGSMASSPFGRVPPERCLSCRPERVCCRTTPVPPAPNMTATTSSTTPAVSARSGPHPRLVEVRTMIDLIERITTAAVPAPAGHYSQATAWRDLVFVSGQLAPPSPSRFRSVHLF
ncbi:MAG: hypothetical protein U1E38_08420 [Rhodospirillales bacterium]